MTLLKSGMRKGELMGLRWSDIDLNEKYFDINSTRGDYGENKPKTKLVFVKFILTTHYSL